MAANDLIEVRPSRTGNNDGTTNQGTKYFFGTTASIQQNSTTGQWEASATCANFPVIGTTVYHTGTSGVQAMTCAAVDVDPRPRDFPGFVIVTARYRAPVAITF